MRPSFRAFNPAITVVKRAAFSSAANSQNPIFLKHLKEIEAVDPEKFTQEDFSKRVRYLHDCARTSHLLLPQFTHGSDTGSSIIPEVVAKKAWNNSVVSVFGPNPALVKTEIDAVKRLFIDPTGIRSADEKQLTNLMVFPTASTTQANKLCVEAVGNINKNMGEIALASETSHIFSFEVGQPAMKVKPTDKNTGKLTVEDLQKAGVRYSKLGKKVKMVHLDQPTNGDYFYTQKEIKEITTWAHSRGLAVSMDVERLVNYLPKISQDSYFSMTADCGVDVVTLGMQKNGGARSSAVIVLNREYISDEAHLEQRVGAFIKCLGGVTNNETFITSGWEDMVKDCTYQKNAIRANDNSTKIADVISKFTFYKSEFPSSDGDSEAQDLEIQNNPLTTNMIFAKFPRDFVRIFNKITKAAGNDISLNPDRKGVTRIVTSHDTPSEDVDDIIWFLEKAYELHSDLRKNNAKLSDIKEFRVEDFHRMTKSDSTGPDLTTGEVKELFKALIRKSEEAIILKESYNGVNRKFTDRERAMDPEIITEIFAKNSEGYHKPYGNDPVTAESAAALRREFDIDKGCPVVFTSSKDQAVTCVMQFLKATEESTILVAEGSHDEHCRYGRSVKALELAGEFKETDKLDPRGVASLLDFHNSDSGKHVPLITAVMIEQPTSKGYVYSKDEIREIVKTCEERDIPVILQTSSFAYDLAKTGSSYKEYATDTGVAICTIGLQGLGGGLSSGIVALRTDLLPQYTDESSVSVVLNRAVKENGGKNSDSSTLNAGWKSMLDSGLWRENAMKSNKNIARIKDELKEYKFDGKNLEFENINAANNVISVQFPKDFLKLLNMKGYEFKTDEDGYVKVQVPYTLRDEEVDKFFRHFRDAHKEFSDKKPSVTLSPNDKWSSLKNKAKEIEDVVRKELKGVVKSFNPFDDGR